MTDKPTITQADREAVTAFHNTMAERIMGSDPTLGDTIEIAFAAHRESAVAELQAEVERLNNAIEKICIESNSDWTKVRNEPRAQIDVIHNIAVDAFFYKHALAQKEPVE